MGKPIIKRDDPLSDYINSMLLRPVWREPRRADVPIRKERTAEFEMLKNMVEPSRQDSRSKTQGVSSAVPHRDTAKTEHTNGNFIPFHAADHERVDFSLNKVSASDLNYRVLLAHAIRTFETVLDRDTIAEKFDIPADAYDKFREGNPIEGEAPDAHDLYFSMIRSVKDVTDEENYPLLLRTMLDVSVSTRLAAETTPSNVVEAVAPGVSIVPPASIIRKKKRRHATLHHHMNQIRKTQARKKQ